jgi:hypothetical protein
MKYISSWLPDQREHNMAQAQAIADYNQQHFFSDEFFNLVVSELTANLTTALVDVEFTKNHQAWLDHWEQNLSNPDILKLVRDESQLDCPSLIAINNIKSIINRKLNSK